MIKLSLMIDGKNYEADLSAPFDIAAPVRFDKGGLGAFGADPAREEPFKAGSFIGDVNAGGSCNCWIYTFSPHLHGTHTECVGHITGERIAVHEIMTESFLPATLITLAPEAARESYAPAPQEGDTMITKHALEKVLQNTRGFLDALIIRTDYKGAPPYFSHEAMRYLNELGVRHLLVDMPSVDRLDDDGKLSNHRIFWGVAPGVKSASPPSPKTITELIRVPAKAQDGCYLLNLQVAAFHSDAAPSRPVLYKVKEP